MVEFQHTEFGKTVVDGRGYLDVIVVGGKVLERNRKKSEELYGTSHYVRDDEIELLLKNDPQVVVFGTGQYGRLGVDERVKKKFEEKGIVVVTEKTPDAVKTFNKLSKAKKVNALVHSTC